MSTAAEWFQRGIARQNAGDAFEAINCYGRGIALGEKSFEVYYNLAFALQTIGKEDEALTNYAQAVRLNPNFAEAHNSLGNIFLKRERLEEAQNCYERALSINPNIGDAHFNLGLVLQKRGASTQAVEHFRAVCQLAPERADAWINQCVLLLVLKRTEEWLEAFVSFETTAQPASFLVLTGLASCRYLGDFAREQRYLGQALDWQFGPNDAEMVSRLLGMIQYFDVGQDQLLRLYQRYNTLVPQSHSTDVPFLLPRRTRGDKLRVGYLSPDFRTHVMGLLMAEVFKRHDGSRFEIYAYSLAEPAFDDAVTANFKALSHKFVPVAGLSEQQVARLIAEDDLDILVDLGGHAAYARPAILAYKPARIQVTHLGYHGALGLDTVDYKLTDSYADLPENADFLVENLLPMEGCVFPFRHVEPARDHGYSRTALGLDGKVVFSVFVNIMKLSPRCLSVWRAVLDQVENGVLAFSPLDTGEYPGFVRQVKAAGIPEEKIVFIPSSNDESLGRARYQLVDIVLDTFPYSGGDTTLAALDMGVPVVTLVGKRHRERTSYSILKNLGVESTIAASEQDFVAIAHRLATSQEFLESVKNEIQAGLKDSPLVDMDGYVRHLEAAYLRAVEEKALLSGAVGKLSVEELKSLFQEALKLHQANQLVEAEKLYRQVLEDQPEYAPASYMLGMLLKAQGETGLARTCLDQAIRHAPHYADAWAALGRLDHAEGRDAEAIDAFRHVLAVRPESIEILNDLGLALGHQGQTKEAIEILRQAVTVRPNDANSHFNLGVAFQKLALPNEAIGEYLRAIMLQPDGADAYFNLGVALQDFGQGERAAGYYRRVLELQPGNASAYQALGEVLLAGGKIGLWLENFQQFEKHCEPGLQLALYALETCQYLGATKKGERYLNGLLKEAYPPKDQNDLLDGLSQLLFLLLYFDVDERQMLHLYERYNLALKQAFPERMVLPEVRSPGKIRLGYLSADLRNHVMGKMMYQAISRHDTSRFEVYCYSLSHVQDEWTDRFVAASHKFVKLKALDEVAAANLIAQDELDILVDLSSHTHGGSPGILAMKPARVQITHIASAGAVGCDAIDYKLTDHFADLPDSQNTLVETLLPMQGCVYPYRHIPPALDHGYDRSRLGLPENAVTLGAFVTLLKLSTRCLAIWRTVLERLPMAYLVFSPLSAEARPYYLKRIKKAGIDATRVVFIPAGADESVNQARYSMVDISLDPFPYGGANGTIEALDMGVPVVTLCGKRHGERSSFSIMKNLGVTETVAQSGQEYVNIVARLATNPLFRSAVREKILTGLAHSPLVDMDGHARHLETAYIQALGEKGVAGFDEPSA
jgi:predicted O-linked N-acetylglucosamine transferase (SPINDLY family)